MPLRGPSFLLPNIVTVTKPYVEVTTPATAVDLVPAGFEPDYLKTEDPSDVARIATLDPLYTRWKVTTNGVPFTLGAIGVPNIKLSAGGKYRIVGHTDSSAAVSTLTLAPNSIEFENNSAGNVANVDEAISSPDGNYISPTNTAIDWAIVFGFPALAATPRTGEGMAQFVVRANRSGTPENDEGTPTIRAILFENGLAVPGGEFLGRAPITSEAPGQIFIFHFNPGLLDDPSGANLEVRLEFQPGDDSSFARIDSVALYYESAAVALSHDSGWLSSPFETFADQDDPPPTKSLGYWPTTPLQEAEAFELLIADDQTHHLTASELDGTGVASGVLINALRETPSGFVEAGVLPAGGVVTFGNRSSGGDTPGIVGPITPGGHIAVEQFGGVVVGGQTYSADAFRRVELQVELTITRDELLIFQERIAWRRGKRGAFYFALEPDISASRQLFTSGWFTLKDHTHPSRLPGSPYDEGSGEMLYVVTIYLEQKL